MEMAGESLASSVDKVVAQPFWEPANVASADLCQKVTSQLLAFFRNSIPVQ